MKKLVSIGGSGKIGSYCLKKWLNSNLIEKVWNFDLKKITEKNLVSIEKNVLEKDGYENLKKILNNEKPNYFIVFAGYDFPQINNKSNYFSPYEPNMEIINKAWEINCGISYLVLKAIEECNLSNISITLIGSIYGDKLPNANLYSDNSDMYKPVVYGMCKSALEYLNKQASIHLAKKGGRCNLVRFGGVDIGINNSFRIRYSSISPSGKMVSLDSVLKTLTFMAFDDVSDLNGAIIDLDSGMRHK